MKAKNGRELKDYIKALDKDSLLREIRESNGVSMLQFKRSLSIHTSASFKNADWTKKGRCYNVLNLLIKEGKLVREGQQNSVIIRVNPSYEDTMTVAASPSVVEEEKEEEVVEKVVEDTAEETTMVINRTPRIIEQAFYVMTILLKRAVMENNDNIMLFSELNEKLEENFATKITYTGEKRFSNVYYPIECMGGQIVEGKQPSKKGGAAATTVTFTSETTDIQSVQESLLKYIQDNFSEEISTRAKTLSETYIFSEEEKKEDNKEKDEVSVVVPDPTPVPTLPVVEIKKSEEIVVSDLYKKVISNQAKIRLRVIREYGKLSNGEKVYIKDLAEKLGFETIPLMRILNDFQRDYTTNIVLDRDAILFKNGLHLHKCEEKKLLEGDSTYYEIRSDKQISEDAKTVMVEIPAPQEGVLNKIQSLMSDSESHSYYVVYYGYKEDELKKIKEKFSTKVYHLEETYSLIAVPNNVDTQKLETVLDFMDFKILFKR